MVIRKRTLNLFSSGLFKCFKNRMVILIKSLLSYFAPEDANMNRLTQLDKRNSTRRQVRKRPAASTEEVEQAECEDLGASPKATRGSKGKGRGKGRGRGKKKDTDAGKGKASKAKAKAKPKARAKAKMAEKKEKSKTDKGKKDKGKGQVKGTKATFARRVQPGKEPRASWWTAVRDAFNATIKPKVRHFSNLEDSQIKKIIKGWFYFWL